MFLTLEEGLGGIRELGTVWSSVCLGGHLLPFLSLSFSLTLSASTAVPLLLDLDTKVCAVACIFTRPRELAFRLCRLCSYLPYHTTMQSSKPSRLCINNVSHTLVSLRFRGCFGARVSPPGLARALIFLSQQQC